MASGRFVQVDGINLFYRQLGTGPDLVCLHGFPTSSWDWHLILPELARHFRVTVFDLPGYGLSDKPPGRSYSLLPGGT
jgi:pimeloyl-ACP methyl ester carboxylesterase